jgi:U2 small nuclear ribonucleoprotein B''
VLKKSLEALFSTYGTVVSVTAHSNVRMRGQAFVAFDSKEPAAKAVSEVVGFPLYGKPMVSQVTFAGP